MAFRISSGVVLFGVAVSLLSSPTFSAAPCKGPNKNDPGCPGTEPAPAAAASTVVDSVTVDWANEKIIVRGADLDTVTDFTLGGSVPLTPGASSPTQVELLFDADIAAAVAGTGSYALQIDGSDAISIYFVSAVVDPAATGCPCAVDWAAELVGLWGAAATTCYEVSATGVADLAGTVLTDPLDSSVYPQFPIGAAYYAGDPLQSVCRLVEVSETDPYQQDLVNVRINAAQQAECAVALQTNVCATTETVLSP
ncbi:hypothetical protein [Haliea sp. E17]|uniref:hypothetical protein n=1 Tax=Haliea sp. E17 TaxID=3401576 RepID=UPI003AADFC26